MTHGGGDEDPADPPPGGRVLRLVSAGPVNPEGGTPEGSPSSRARVARLTGMTQRIRPQSVSFWRESDGGKRGMTEERAA